MVGGSREQRLTRQYAAVEPAARIQRPSCMRNTILSVLGLAMLLVACGTNDSSGNATQDKGSATSAPSPSTTSTEPESASGDGEAAVWVIRDAHSVSTESKEFTADVTGLGCNDGVTGTVLRPTIREDAAQIVVTFTVEPVSPGAHTCPGNNFVPTVIKLQDPIGQRQLVDGACDPGGAAVSTAWCRVEFADPVRWSP